MAPTPQYAPSPGQRPTEHRRNKSASMLKAMMTPKSPHKRYPSDGSPLTKQTNYKENSPVKGHKVAMPILPADHPHSQQRVLGELQNSHNNGSSEKKAKDEQPKGLHKKTKSAVSLRSLGRDKEGKGDKDKADGKEDKKKLKGVKSGSNLAAMFSKPKSPSKKLDRRSRADSPSPKGKENTTPPSSATPKELYTPIWSQFTSQPLENVTTTTIPLNDRTSMEMEIARYSAEDYSPSKQRNFYDYQPPSLVPKGSRPNSMFFSNVQPTSSIKDATRKLSSDIKRKSGDYSRKSSTDSVPKAGKATDTKALADQNNISEMAKKRGSRVMAAVAVFNNKSKPTDNVTDRLSKLDPKALNEAFEALMDARNISGETREKLRTMAPHVKEDFLRKDQFEPPSPTKVTTESKPSSRDKSTSRRPTWGRSGKSSDGSGRNEGDGAETLDDTTNGKRGRPRSRTFTFHKGDSSPTKKQKGDMITSTRPKSIEIPKSPSSKSLASLVSPGGSQIWGSAKQQATPEEYVRYLRKEQKLENVEVGKIHKLRLLLRNETVSWVDSFLEQGGMKEIIILLQRIMEVEWREGHEDALLHETLLCLKGLCTTDLALRKLQNFESTLFPALLAMLFDTEHKGPSEFTTRGIIINLLFTQLSAASPEEATDRARTILSYMSDPRKSDEERPLPFITQMHKPRPYRVWGREVSNVTKEVFWIFMHHLNVVPLPRTEAVLSFMDVQDIPSSSNRSNGGPPKTPRIPTPPDASIFIEDLDATAYAAQHYPRPRPPVPAAPYVGGVEWDATHYMTAHIDLLNGLLASLPQRAERNQLRAEMRDSGWEKVMGGTLRTCKEKFYGHVHDALRTWVAAAVCDGWDVRDVRMGPKKEESTSPRKNSSPAKSPKKNDAPKLELPALGNLGGGAAENNGLGNAAPSGAMATEWI